MSTIHKLPGVKLYQGDCREVLRRLPDESVHCCVTSPPYWGLRDYGTGRSIWGGNENCKHRWHGFIQPAADGTLTPAGNSALRAGHQGNTSATMRPKRSAFCARCGAWRGQLGLEPTPELFVEHLVMIFRQVRRVLRDDGTLWLNIGDSYASGKGTCFNPGGGPKSLVQEKQRYPLDRGNKSTLAAAGLKSKDLVGIPWMLAFALRADGWFLRSDIIWNKPNPMPESVIDRPTKSHEYLFLLTKSARYYYDGDAVKEPCASGPSDVRKMLESRRRIGGKHKTLLDRRLKASAFTNIGQKRAVGGTKIHGNIPGRFDGGRACNDPGQLHRNRRSVWTITTVPYRGAHFATFPPKLIEPCIRAGCPDGGTVLDPFFGAGTTALVCKQQDRNLNCIGIELSKPYCRMARTRIGQIPAAAA